MNYYAPKLELWTDAGSLCHVAWGVFAGLLEPRDTVAVAAIFTGYQLGQHHNGERMSRVGAELIEFGLGVIAARFFR